MQYEMFTLCQRYSIPHVPLLNNHFREHRCGNYPLSDFEMQSIPFDFDTICTLAEGPSLVPGANHIREGVVVTPWNERYDEQIGRVKLKWVSAAYLERSK